MYVHTFFQGGGIGGIKRKNLSSQEISAKAPFPSWWPSCKRVVKKVQFWPEYVLLEISEIFFFTKMPFLSLKFVYGNIFGDVCLIFLRLFLSIQTPPP